MQAKLYSCGLYDYRIIGLQLANLYTLLGSQGFFWIQAAAGLAAGLTKHSILNLNLYPQSQSKAKLLFSVLVKSSCMRHFFMLNPGDIPEVAM